MSFYPDLTAELIEDPLGQDYANMTDQEAADSLNALTRTLTVPQVPISQVAMWSAKTGVRAKIEAHASNVASPVQSVCLALVDLFRGLGSPTLNLGDADNLAMCDALVMVGVMDAGQKASLLALQNSPISRAVELWGFPVSNHDVAKARSL